MPFEHLTLSSLGWTPELEQSFSPYRAKSLQPARVVVEDKHHFVVFSEAGVLRAQCAGKVLHHAKSPAELPKVGDWVAIVALPAEEKAVIHHLLPRKTRLSRKVSGRKTDEQVLVTNVDVAFIVQSLDTGFNPRRIERFTLMVREGGLRPVIVLNKADLATDLAGWQAEAQKVAGDTPILIVSAHTGKGMKSLRQHILPHEAAVFIGSSGVGKSSLINRLYGDEVQATTEVRANDSKGRHTTSWRELIVLPQGGLVIDTPGMREFHLWMAGDGIHETFPDLEELAAGCRFTNCSHTTEKLCAVLAAVENGSLERERYQSFLKLTREVQFLEKAAQLKRTPRAKTW
ncbi:MAG: ribosome small subunit-dependent GTPase A [Verrucomicrobiota bacterium]